MRFVLDTNILISYLKENRIRKHIQENLKPFNVGSIPIISVISLGEIESLALRNYWGSKRRSAVGRLINSCVITDINSRDVIRRYAEIDAFSQGKLSELPLHKSSRNMGKNDLWIAATSSVLDAKLITTDKDFAHLDKVFLDLEFVEI